MGFPPRRPRKPLYSNRLRHDSSSQLARLLRWSGAPFRWWWRNTTTLIVGIPLVIIVILLGTWISAKLLHAFSPKAEIIISPFELPAGTDHLPWTGKTVANLFIDELQEIISHASEFHGQQFASKLGYPPVPDLPKIPIEKNFELQFEGLSLKQVLSAWHYLRYDQELFSGDVLLNPDGTLILRARVAADNKAMYWQVKEIESGTGVPRDLNGLRKALRKLAVEVFTSLNPETLGRYFLAEAMASHYPNKRYRLEEAQKVFAEWIKREPTRPEPFFYLSYTYSCFPDRQQESMRAAEQALANDSSFYEAKGMIAWQLDQGALNGRKSDRKQHLTQAIEMYKEALKSSKKWWQLWTNDPPNYWNNLCAEYSDLNIFSEAKTACENALRSDPQYAMPRSNLGGLYETSANMKAANLQSAENDLLAAESAYRSALKVQPDFFDALTGLVTVLLNPLWHPQEGGDARNCADGRDCAIKECERAIAAFPQAAEPLIELGRFYANEKNPSLATKYYENATQRDPDNPNGWNALAWAEFEAGDFKDSAKHFQRAYQLDGEAGTLASWGQAIEEDGEQYDGWKIMMLALDRRPALSDDKWFQMHLGNAHLRMNQFLEALEAYASAELDERQSESKKESLLGKITAYRRHLGDAFFGAGELERAAVCYISVKESYSEDGEFKHRLRALLKKVHPSPKELCTAQTNDQNSPSTMQDNPH
jgi:tetratricopeptide (TPR) repeat protein